MRRLICLAILLLAGAPALPQERGRQREIEAFILADKKEKGIPAAVVTVVEDQKVLWSKAFGSADLKGTKPATDETLFCVGSVSKLFTDIALMQLVEEGKVDLDAEVKTYLPDFAPKNPFDKKITIRMLLSHRSGLVREPPVGNYFDGSEPGLEKTVASLNGTEIVYEPGTRTKYSNAAIAVVGRIIEKIDGKPFAEAVNARVLKKLGMDASSFAPTDAVKKDRAEAEMWTYHGRKFPAPTFQLGWNAAGSLFSNGKDMAKFMSCLFRNGEGLLKPESMKEMLKPQFGASSAFGLGFILGTFDGTAKIGHSGAVYGFATELTLLPEKKLGVFVSASKDVMNAWSSRIADHILRTLLAERENRPPVEWRHTTPMGRAAARLLEGRYANGTRSFDLVAQEERLMMLPGTGTSWEEVRNDGTRLFVDDGQSYGPELLPGTDGSILLNGVAYTRQKPAIPDAPPADMQGLIGEYGPEFNVLYILERDGKLWCNIEWTSLYPLTKESDNVYKFPNYGMYHGEKLVFDRDAKGKATKVTAAGVAFPRRKLDGEEGETFKIKPTGDVAELRKKAEMASPPKEPYVYRKSELVDLVKLDPTIKTDLRYATANNFLDTPVYTNDAKAYMQKPAAEAVVRVQKKLAKEGLGLIIYDAYRPWSITKVFWDATEEKYHDFVADPSKGSRHNRGCAVDLGLYDPKAGKPVEVVAGFDEFSDRAYPNYMGGTSRQRYYRDLLRRTMESEGFTVYEGEWWHFDYKDWKQYGIGNQGFGELLNK